MYITKVKLKNIRCFNNLTIDLSSTEDKKTWLVIVGNNGVIYALDIHPLAIKTVKKKIKKGAIKNIKTILSSRNTGLPDEGVDIVLLYDVLQMIGNKEKLLEELHRVVKPDGRFFATSEHLANDEFIDILTKGKLFILVSEKGKLFKFRRN